MSTKPHHDASDIDETQPVEHEQRRPGDAKAKEAEAHLRRAEAALRGQPEDKREAARQTTPAGKGRSQ